MGLCASSSNRFHGEGEDRPVDATQDVTGRGGVAADGQGGGGGTPVLPLWQSKIVMGERCELPRFSGLILYDERGLPLLRSRRLREKATAPCNQEKQRAASTAIRDLL